MNLKVNKEASHAAMVHSFPGNCKMNNVEPFPMLKDVLTRMPEKEVMLTC